MNRIDPLEKTGYRIPRSVVAQVREAVESGEARSQNEFVERALRRELRSMEQRRLYEEYARASADPDFMEEMVAETSTWSSASGDGLSGEDG